MIKSRQQIIELLEQELGKELENFFIVARTKDKEDLIYDYSGDAIELSGLSSWFNQFINKVGFEQTQIDLDDIKN